MTTGTRWTVRRRVAVRCGPALVAVAAVAGTALACKVPVFRYALERWAPAPYHVVVLARGGLPPTDPRLAGLGAGGRPLVTLEVVDAAGPLTGGLAEAWAAHGRAGEPVAVVHYPRSPAVRGSGAGGRRVAHVARLDDRTAVVVRTSPVRARVAELLTGGAAAVWILVETGAAEADRTAREALGAALARERDTSRLPDAAELEIDPAALARARIPLAIDFPLVSVARDDPREAFLVDCLLGSEDDLRDFDEPIAFPVFGRGVVLHALVGRGINTENVAAANAFITGACSCVVKEQNPGFDLPLDVDWDAAVGDVLVSEPPPAAGAAPKLLTIPPGSRR